MSNLNFELPASQPAQPTKGSSSWALYLLAILAGWALGMLTCSIFLTTDDGAEPSPNPTPTNIVSTLEKAERQRLENEAMVSEKLGDMVADGKIQNSRQFAELAKQYSEAARESAFKSVNELNQKIISEPEGNGDWNKVAIKDLQYKKAEAKRKVAN